jgi:hypothetical protein
MLPVNDCMLHIAALSPEELFSQKCVARTGKSVVIASGPTYTIQKAYVWGTSCYALSLEAKSLAPAYEFCTAIDTEMHAAFLQTPSEFATVDNLTNHVYPSYPSPEIKQTIFAANSTGLTILSRYAHRTVL